MGFWKENVIKRNGNFVFSDEEGRIRGRYVVVKSFEERFSRPTGENLDRSSSLDQFMRFVVESRCKYYTALDDQSVASGSKRSSCSMAERSKNMLIEEGPERLARLLCESCVGCPDPEEVVE